MLVHLGPVVAAVLESPGHADTFALYFQLGDEAARGTFLLERGIGLEELAVVRQELQRMGLVAREEERRWWRAILDQRGVAEPLPPDDALSEHVRAALAQAGVTPTGVADLLRAGGHSDARADTRPAGPLATLEREGFDLHALHLTLRERGDDGLEVRVARDRLRQWIAAHGHLAAAALRQRGRAEEAAKAAAARWRVPPATAWRIDPTLSEVLAHVVADLGESGMQADPEALADDAPTTLAGLAGLSLDGLRASAAALFAAEGAAERTRALVHRWRAMLVPLLVALRTRPEDWGSRIRDEERHVEASLPSPPQVGGLIDAVVEMLREDAAAEALVEALRMGQHDQAPPGDLLARLPAGHPDIGHLERVRRELDGVRRKRASELRKDRKILRDAGLAPAAPPGMKAPPAAPARPAGRREIPLGSVRRNQRRLDALGRAGERWALAAVLDPVLALGASDRRAVVDQLLASVQGAFKGAAVARIEALATAAREAADDDDEFTLTFADFAHLSSTSDYFGCDAIAWLAPAPGAAPLPLLIEIKSDADRAFPVSVNEWQEAGRLGEAYAFLVVLRGADADAAPTALELLVNPAALAGNVLELEPDGHIVRYRVAKESA